MQLEMLMTHTKDQVVYTVQFNSLVSTVSLHAPGPGVMLAVKLLFLIIKKISFKMAEFLILAVIDQSRHQFPHKKFLLIKFYNKFIL